jgi:hypothetical protein
LSASRSDSGMHGSHSLAGTYSQFDVRLITDFGNAFHHWT